MNKSAKTPELESTPDPLGPNGLWQTPSKKIPEKQHLPFYVEAIAHALQRQGMDESTAIATALNSVKRWAEGGGNVHPEVRQAAQRAVAEWERLRSAHQ